MTLSAMDFLEIAGRHQEQEHDIFCSYCLALWPCDASVLASDIGHLQMTVLYAAEAGKADERSRIRTGIEGLVGWRCICYPGEAPYTPLVVDRSYALAIVDE